MTTTTELTGDKSRLEWLQDMVSESKKSLKYWEELVTHEVCLQNGMIYPVSNNERID